MEFGRAGLFVLNLNLTLYRLVTGTCAEASTHLYRRRSPPSCNITINHDIHNEQLGPTPPKSPIARVASMTSPSYPTLYLLTPHAYRPSPYSKTIPSSPHHHPRNQAPMSSTSKRNSKISSNRYFLHPLFTPLKLPPTPLTPPSISPARIHHLRPLPPPRLGIRPNLLRRQAPKPDSPPLHPRLPPLRIPTSKISNRTRTQ